MRGLSPVAASGVHSSSRCSGLSLSRPLLLRSTGSRRADSVVVAHGPSCSAACGIFPDQGSNPCLLHWQADSQTTAPSGKPFFFFFKLRPFPFFFLIYLFIYFWLHWVFHQCARAFSSCGEQGLLFIAVCGLLVVVASLVAEHGFEAHGLQ